MARARNIKPGFFKNEELAELSPETRLLFIGLWTLADREGRLEDRPKRIKAEIFAFDSFDVDAMLSELQSKMFLTRYAVGNMRFIAITNFVKHQDPHYREKASEIPPPDGVSNSIKATNVTRSQRQRIFERDGFRCKKCNTTEQLSIDHIQAVANGGDSSDSNLQVLCYSCNFDKRAKDDRTSTDVGAKTGGETRGQPPLIPDSPIPDSPIPDSPIPDSGKGNSVERGAAQASATPPTPRRAVPAGTRLAPDFVLPAPWGEWALQERPGWTADKVRSVAEQFRDHWHAKAGREALKADWLAAWRNWVRRESVGVNGTARPHAASRQSALEQRNAEVAARWLAKKEAEDAAH